MKPRCCEKTMGLHGVYKSKKRGMVQRYRCSFCGRTSIEISDSLTATKWAGSPSNQKDRNVVRIIALLALGVTQRETAKRSDVSLDTVSRTVEWFYAEAGKPDGFERFCRQLVKEFKVTDARWRVRELWLCLAMNRRQGKSVDHLEKRREFPFIASGNQSAINALSLGKGD